MWRSEEGGGEEDGCMERFVHLSGCADICVNGRKLWVCQCLSFLHRVPQVPEAYLVAVLPGLGIAPLLELPSGPAEQQRVGELLQ